MANVKVAVRVRPLSQKELDAEAINIVDVNEDVLSITNLKINSSEGDRHRERIKNYSFDHCYNSLDRQADSYASQELIYQDLGTEVLNASFEGYNVCLFAYGQTGSGKTYTVMGDDVDPGLIPRICEGMCSRVDDLVEGVTFKIEVSYLEIYNERVRDLLVTEIDTNYTLKVREHPKDGPYVQDLTRHLVSDFDSVMMLIVQGNRNRTTAATHMHEASSRSHAIFTLTFVQAKMVNNMPSEIVSRINLVDLAGSERANLNYSKGRLQEGANINKSLVTLGNCISALGMDSEDDDAESSRTLSTGSMESLALSEDIDMSSTTRRRSGFVPYRNSVLTWLLKDSLGGNSRTIMIATISPSSIYFNETMSTLRYARRAKRIINQPFINEEPNVRLIRELRAEINRLKSLLSSASLSSSQASLVQDVTISKMLAENEQKVDQLTAAWVDKWREAARIMQECNVGIRRESMGVIVESELPHLIGMDDDLLSTGIILYHLLEGRTTIGREDSEIEQDIVLWGPGIECQHAVIVNHQGRVALHPVNGAACAVNGNDIREPTQLSQGAVILLGKTNMFRFNHPAEAARLREKRASSLKPADVEEIRRPRKNSVTLRVHNNITAITEEGNRIRKISLSRETPTANSDGLSLSRGRSPNTTISPASEVSSIMMYNPGVELERQHKLKVEKVERTRKRLEELQDKAQRAEAAHKQEQQKMKIAYEDHQRMIQEQTNVLQKLRDEHDKTKMETERELQEMREALAKEKEQGQKQLEEQQQSLTRDQAKKASISALDGAAFPPVIAKETEQPSDLSVLDVDRKKLTQLELLHRQSQHKAEAVLERRQATFDRQRSASIRLIEQEERRLHEIECIPSLSDRFASASSESLDSSLRSEDDTSTGWSSKENETRTIIGWTRVSPIGGRSDSDSANSRNTSTSSDKEENVITSTNTHQVTPPSSLDAVASNEPVPHKTIKTHPKSQHPSTTSSKPHTAEFSTKTKTASNSVFSRLYQQRAPKFDYLRRTCGPQTVYAEEQTQKQTTLHIHQPRVKQRSLTDGAIDIKSRGNNVHDKPIHSKSLSRGSSAPAAHNQLRDSQKSKSMLRTKSTSPSYPGQKRPLNKIPPTQSAKNTPEVKATDATSLQSKSKSRTPKLQTSSRSECKPSARRSITPSKSETKLPAAAEQKLSGRPRRTKTPTSESAIETKKPHEKAGKDKQTFPATKEKSPPKGKETEKAAQPRITKPPAKTANKLNPKQTANSEAFFVTLGGDGDAPKNAENKLDSSDSNNFIDVFHEEEHISLERQPAIGCSESMEDVKTVSIISNPSDIVDKHFDRDLSKEDATLSDSYPDSLEDFKDQHSSSAYHLHDIENEDRSSSGEVLHCENGDLSPRRRKNGFSMEKEDHFSVHLDEVLEDTAAQPQTVLENDSDKSTGPMSISIPDVCANVSSASGLFLDFEAALSTPTKGTDLEDADKIKSYTLPTDGKDNSADQAETKTSGQKGVLPPLSDDVRTCETCDVQEPKAKCVEGNKQITRKVEDNKTTLKSLEVETGAQKQQNIQSMESEDLSCEQIGNAGELKTQAEHRNGNVPPLYHRLAIDGASVSEDEVGAVILTFSDSGPSQSLVLAEGSVSESLAAKNLTKDEEMPSSQNDPSKDVTAHYETPSSAASLNFEASDEQFPSHKSGKRSGKCRTAVKHKPEQNQLRQEQESPAPSTVWKSTSASHPSLPFGLLIHDDMKDQPDRCSSSLSTCSSSTYSSEISRSESLRSRSPDDEVALISDGVSDPPDLSDLPATPTDLIVKPLPSPKTLVESVFWDSSSSKSHSSDEKLLDDGINPEETDKVFEGESDHSSDPSDHDEALAEDPMENSGDLTVLAVGALDDTATVSLQSTTPVKLYNKGTSGKTSVKCEDFDNPLFVHPIASLSQETSPDVETPEDKASFKSQNLPQDGLIKDSVQPCNNELQVVSDEREGSVNKHASENGIYVSRLYIEPFQKTLDFQSKDLTSKHSMLSVDESAQSEVSSLSSVQQGRTCHEIGTTHQQLVPMLSESVREKPRPDSPILDKMAMSNLSDEESIEQYNSETLKIAQQTTVALSSEHLYGDKSNCSQLPSLEAEDTMLPKTLVGTLGKDVINRHTGTTNEGDLQNTRYVLDNSPFQVREASSNLDDACQCSDESVFLKNSHVDVERRENMIPDGASVESKPDEPQTSVKRGKMATYVNLAQMQEELTRLRIILGSLVIDPLLSEVEQMHSRLAVGGDVSARKSPDTQEKLETQFEASQSNTPDSTSDELSLIEQLRRLSEKIGPSLSKDTPSIINQARFLSDHLEHAHSSVYSPSLVEELRELSKQLDASWFLTIEKSDQVALSLDEKQKDSDMSGLFHSAQDLTLYQTAFEVTQENLYPVPPSSFLVTPVPMQSTPVSNESDPHTLNRISVKSPTVSPFTIPSSCQQPECFDGEYSPSADENISDDSTNSEDALDTAERVISEMSSFRLQLDILSGSDTLGDNDSDSNSSEDSSNDTEPLEGDDDKTPETQDICGKTRPSLSSRHSLECFLPTICEECLSSSDIDEPTFNSSTADFREPGHEEERNAQNSEDGKKDPCFDKAVPCELCDRDANEMRTVDYRRTERTFGKEESLDADDLQPFMGKEFTATKAKLNMLVRILGGNWESVEATSSEGSGPSSPTQTGTLSIHKDQSPFKDTDPEVEHTFRNPFVRENVPVVLTYDESAQTDWFSEEDLANQTQQIEEGIPSYSMEQVDKFLEEAQLKLPSGVTVTNKFVQTTLSQTRESRTVHVSSSYLWKTDKVHDIPHAPCTSPCQNVSNDNTPRKSFSIKSDDEIGNGKDVEKQKAKEQTYQQSEVREDISSSFFLFLMPKEPLLTKTMVVVERDIIHFPPCEVYKSASPVCVKATEDVEPSSIETAHEINLKITKDSHDMIILPENDSKDIITQKPTDLSDGTENEIPNIRLFGPVEEVLLKEAVTVHDEPIVWPTENPNSESNRSSCEMSNTNSLFQPIREESNSAQSASSNPDPSSDSLPPPDEPSKTPGHEQQLQVPVEHGGDKNLKDLKELSTAMGLSPQRSYSTDEELIQIFSKGVAHFRSLKQDAMTVKPVLVAVATNTSPIKTGHDVHVTKVDAAVMTDMEVEKVHAYTSMSPEFEKELLLNQTQKVIPEQVKPNASFTASQLISKIVNNSPEKLAVHEITNSDSDKIQVCPSPNQIDFVPKSVSEPVDQKASVVTSLSTQETDTKAVHQQPEDLKNHNSKVSDNFGSVGGSSSVLSPSPTTETTLRSTPTEVKSNSPTQKLESLDTTFLSEEQRLLAELRKRTRASQQAAKRAMAFALELRQKNLSDTPSGNKYSASYAEQFERKTSKYVDENLDESGEENLAKFSKEDFTTRNHKPAKSLDPGQADLMKDQGPRARIVEDEGPVSKNCPIYERANRECIHPGYPLARFAQNIFKLMQNRENGQAHQIPQVTSNAGVKKNKQAGAPNLDKSKENSVLLQSPQLKDEDLDLMDDCHQQTKVSHTTKEDDHLETNSHSRSTDNQPVLEMVNEQIQREAICCLDSESLTLRLARLQPFGPLDRQEEPKTSAFKMEQAVCSRTLTCIKVENSKDTSFRLPTIPKDHSQKWGTDRDILRLKDGESLKPVNIKREFLIPPELVKEERVSTVPTSEYIKAMLDKLTDATKANDNMAETGTKQDKNNFDATNGTAMPPRNISDDSRNTSNESGKTTSEVVLKRRRPFFPAFSDISFDLDNDDDDDLRALKEMNKNIDRAIAETSSPESDFEDDMEPELIELADDETDSFGQPEGTVSSGSSLRDPPQNVVSAPAVLFPQRWDNSISNTDEGEKDNDDDDDDVTPLHLRGILISPDKLEWLLADSESSSSTRSSPKEKDIPSNSKYEPTDIHAHDIGDDKYVVETSQGIVNKHQSGLYEADRILSQTWPLKKVTESQNRDTPTLENEIQDLKNMPVIRARSLVAYPLVKSRDCHTRVPSGESSTSEGRASPDSVVNSLTQSSGVFSASTRDMESSWLREGRLSSQRVGSVGSEGEKADLSQIHREYHNILADISESERKQLTTPTNAFTQTDDESPSSSGTVLNVSSETDLETSFRSDQPSPSRPSRESIPGVATKLDKRRDIAVELMEASLMHGIGETDAFLKFIDSDLPLEDWKSPDVQMRHRRSRSLDAPSVLDVEVFRREPSPSKFKPRPGTTDIFQSQISDQIIQPVSSTPSSDEGLADSSACSSPSPKGLPSENRRFLQQLRSKIVLTTSTHRPERVKINALLQDSWMSSATSEEKSKPSSDTPSLNNDIEALLEESRNMREKSRAEIAKAEQNLNCTRFVKQERQIGSTQRTPHQNLSQDERPVEHYTSTWNGHATASDPFVAGARPKSTSALLSDMERLHPQKRPDSLTYGNQESLGISRPRRPRSAHATFDTFNCKDAIDREIQCLKAASAAMSIHSSPSSDVTTWRSQPHCGHTATLSDPPPLQRYLHSYDREMPQYVAQSFTGDLGSRSLGTMPPGARPQHAHVIPIIALHPPSPDEEIDPSSIPAIARANQVLIDSYRKTLPPADGRPFHQDQAWTSVFSENGERWEFSYSSTPQANLKGSDRPSSSEGSGSQSPSPPKVSPSNSVMSVKGRSELPEVPLTSSPPRRTGKHSRRSSQEKINQELPPIIETPLDSWVTLYQLVADQAMAYLIRETTLTGNIDPHLPKQPSKINGWRYLGCEKDTFLWQKTNRYCYIDSFLGLSILRAPAQTIFNLINNSSTYNCLHECITNVKLLHKIDNTMKVVRIQCAMDQWSLQQPREFCCVIKQAHQHGRWYIVSASVKHPLCPVVSSTVRGQILCCGLSMEPVSTSVGEHCRISYISQIDLQGDLKPKLANRLTTRLPLCLAHLRKCVEIGQL